MKGLILEAKFGNDIFLLVLAEGSEPRSLFERGQFFHIMINETANTDDLIQPGFIS